MEVTGVCIKKFDFALHNSGEKDSVYEDCVTKTHYDCLKLFVDDDIVTLIMAETNWHTSQNLRSPLYST